VAVVVGRLGRAVSTPMIGVPARVGSRFGMAAVRSGGIR
jgi:hypothetical protein